MASDCALRYIELALDVVHKALLVISPVCTLNYKFLAKYCWGISQALLWMYFSVVPGLRPFLAMMSCCPWSLLWQRGRSRSDIPHGTHLAGTQVTQHVLLNDFFIVGKAPRVFLFAHVTTCSTLHSTDNYLL